MGTQRRYSVTGQTPPAASTSCGLCQRGAEAGPYTTTACTASSEGGAEDARGRKRAHAPSPPDLDLDLHLDLHLDTATHPDTHPDHGALPSAAATAAATAAAMEHLALSPPHSRSHSLDGAFLAHKAALHLHHDWAASQRTHCIPAPVPETPTPTPTAPHLVPPAPHVPPTLLTLPPEIRHHIYRHCDELVFAHPLLYCITTAFDKIQHPLAAVSRQVRAEALAIFYSYNTWTVKVEFAIMYEGFQHWIIRLGHGAASLRRVHLSVRGTLFKPRTPHPQSVLVHGQLMHIPPGLVANATQHLYAPLDGDASFDMDLSEKYPGGAVQLVRNDGTADAGETARAHLAKLVQGLWEKRRAGTLNGQDWVTTVDKFITFIGGWVSHVHLFFFFFFFFLEPH
ncbi:hypothetical protein ACEQ8H_008665 [Pleosporales sp. CAS-2024a]